MLEKEPKIQAVEKHHARKRMSVLDVPPTMAMHATGLTIIEHYSLHLNYNCSNIFVQVDIMFNYMLHDYNIGINV
ncbi:MAG: hypothetical protein DSY43_02705 [Gammaproteobacteria bacterium]|nr:MAG: hypothetical protein DSY43_02705 [Gammaproteobacteria bacterium]